MSDRAARDAWLAIDTATDRASVAVEVDGAVAAESTWSSRRRHTVELAPTVARALEAAGVAADELGGIAVAIGPGSYTGLRIGLALAKGLALPRGIPLVGVPTLHVLAAALAPLAAARGVPLWAVLAAGRGRFLAARYPPGVPREAWPAPEGLRVMARAELVGAIEAPALVAGELDAGARAELARAPGVAVASEAMCVRRAAWLAALGREMLAREGAPHGELAPVYSGGAP